HKQAYLGFAKAVNGLHRIANGKQRAPVVRLPTGGQSSDQFQLRVRRVLKLVDEKMQQFEIEAQQQIGGFIRRPQRVQRSDRPLHEIDGAVGTKGEHEMGSRLRQY